MGLYHIEHRLANVYFLRQKQVLINWFEFEGRLCYYYIDKTLNDLTKCLTWRRRLTTMVRLRTEHMQDKNPLVLCKN